MLLKNSIYILSFIFNLFAFVILIFSIVNKNKKLCKKICIFSVIFIIYSIINICLLGILNIPVGLEVLLLCALVFISGILYVISIFINIIKEKKLKSNKENKIILYIMLMLIILPMLFISINIISSKKMLNNSELIIIFNSDGNGGIGDSDTFAYTINKNLCNQFDLGIDTDGYEIKKYLPKELKETNDLEKLNYDVIIDDNETIHVYDNKKEICKFNNDSKYSNIEFIKAFYK